MPEASKFNAIKPKEFKELFARAQAADKQEKEIDDFVRHYFEEIVRERPRLPEPKPEEFVDFFKQFDMEN